MAINTPNRRGPEASQRTPASRSEAAGDAPRKTQNNSPAPSGTSRRGFASMDPAAQRRIASEGGKASHASGRGHEWTSAEAREAGRKGGQSSRNKPKSA